VIRIECVLSSVPICAGAGTVGACWPASRGQRQVDEGVDQQRLAAVGDQPGIAVAPAAVRLQIGVHAVAEIVQTLGERPFRHLCVSSRALRQSYKIDKIISIRYFYR